MNKISKYLKIADLLYDFFEKLGYCDTFCHINLGDRIKSCCGENVCKHPGIYSWESELKQLRDEKINTEIYLTSTGCSAGILKPVYCMVYGCKDLVKYAKEEYDLVFDYKKMIIDVGLIYNEKNNEEFSNLKSELEEMIKKIKNKV
jgi:CRISPR/Cas system CSM-associated protein Csm2 small subunit